jgi:uncharacterized NAD-dependent epimerase/dehydratase family protein
VLSIDATVVLTVGTDCNIGKMTTQLQILDALRARGIRTAFAATGQTGILIEGRGIAIDAVVADFIAGAAERLVLEHAKDADLVLVEGQGSIIHPSYSGVTYGLMHGSLPHAQVMCAQPTRKAINGCEWVKIPPLAEFIRLSEIALAPLRPSPVIAVALNTFDLGEDAARRVVEETGIDLRHRAGDRREEVAHRLGGLDLAARDAGRHRVAHGGQSDVDHVAQRVGGIGSDAYRGHAVGDRHPLVVGRVLQVFGDDHNCSFGG